VSELVLKAVFVFGVVFALDFIWTRYIASVAAKQPMQSALWSTGTILLSGVAAVEYVANPWLLLPAGLGAFAATWIAVKREANREPE
jgi:hypothetical protein